MRAAVAEVGRLRLDRRRRDRRVRGTDRVSLRRGDGTARGDRRPGPVPAHRAAVPPGCRRGRRDRGRRRHRARSRRRTSRWPRPTHDTPAPPTLVDNVETLANVARIVADGADWFRSVGTEQSPGTLVCTVTGRTQRHGVAEMPMGTPLREVIDDDRRRRDRRSRARGCPCPASPTRSSPPRSSTRRSATRRWPRSELGSAPAAISSSTTPPIWSRSRTASPGSSRSSPAGSAGHASRTA